MKSKEEKIKLLFTNWRDVEIAFFDIESCDSKPENPLNDIIQFSMVKFKNGLKGEEYNIYIKPDNPIQEGASKAHGLRKEDLENFPRIHEPSLEDPTKTVVEYIHECIRNCDVLCAYNGLGFDKVMLNKVFAKYDLSNIDDIPFIDPFLWYVHHKGKFSGTRQEDAGREFNVNILGNVAQGEAKLHDSKTDIIALYEITFKMGIKIISAYTLKDLITTQDRIEKKVNKERDKKFGDKPEKVKKEKVAKPTK